MTVAELAINYRKKRICRSMMHSYKSLYNVVSEQTKFEVRNAKIVIQFCKYILRNESKRVFFLIWLSDCSEKNPGV